MRDKASSTTRRSAGLPSLIVGIVSADPDGPLSRKIVQELLLESRAMSDMEGLGSGPRQSQVHAINSLKQIFTSTRLGLSSETYVGDGLDVAAASLSSPQ